MAEDSRLRWSYSLAEQRAMKSVLGNRDAYDFDRTAAVEIDHRVPMLRAQADEDRVNPSDAAAVVERFQLLTGVHNLQKSRACEGCVSTGDRPVFLGIPFWSEGGRAYDPEVGCRGCGWAHPEGWRQALSERLTK